MSFPVELLVQSWFVAGPTAVGKTALVLDLAQELRAEIISLDSMAIYRGMDIGTAKPGLEDRARVPHHLIDVADPSEEFSVSDFIRLAEQAAAAIVSKGKTPLFVGGTGLYLRSILRGMFDGPEADWELRRELQLFAESHGAEALHDRLRQLDPIAADRLHCNDVRRVIRAIEVCQLSGSVISGEQQHGPRPTEEQPSCVVWLHPPRAWLRDRIDRRVDQMMRDGLLQETERLLARRPAISRTARQALGYRELLEHLENGTPLDAAIDRIKAATRQFAKRQHTWFRNLEECHSIEMTGTETTSELCQRVRAAAARRSWS
jgi:tRNA dimethylallyltransferase